MQSTVPPQPQNPQPQPQTAQRGQRPVPPPTPEDDPNADLNNGYDEALFGPTMRPSEPLTTGAPFGPGANFIPRPDEDDRSFTLRVADTLEASGSARLAPYIAKLRFGG